MTQFLADPTDHEMGSVLETAKIEGGLAFDTGMALFMWALDAVESDKTVASVDRDGTVTELVLPYWMR